MSIDTLKEAIAMADAHTTNVGLPSYSDLATALDLLHATCHMKGVLLDDPALLVSCQICNQLAEAAYGKAGSVTLN